MSRRTLMLINIGNMRGWLLERLVARHEDRLLRRFGGIQTCCWCRQVAQLGDSWHFEVWDGDLLLDKLTCGVCGGTSLWRFEMGMIYVKALNPPEPAWPDMAVWNSISEQLRSQESYGVSSGRGKPENGGPDAP